MNLVEAKRGVPYEELAPRIAALVEELIPVGSIVLVVSKGDESLIAFNGRSGWHFPRAGNGQYAGHHPIDGQWAVDHVDALLAAGGAYLVLPATYYWWLEHYPELDLHLRSRFERLTCPEELCRIYRLLELPVWAQWMGEVLPATHFLRVVRGILLKGNGFGEIWPDTWPLILFLFVAGSLALLRFRRTLD